MSSPTSSQFVILVADLTGYNAGFQSHTDAAMARFLDRFYRACEEVIAATGGEIVKFMGDAVLALFPAERASEAVDAAVRLDEQATELAAQHDLRMTLGANLHAGPAVRAELGVGKSRRMDVIGRAVNHAFLMGGGAGIRISEPLYRLLPDGKRAPWTRHGPPATYVLDPSAAHAAPPREA